MLNKKLLALAGLVITGLLLTAGYNRPYRWWPINDMTEQPILKPFHVDGLRDPVEGTVPVDAWDPVPLRTELDQHPEFKNPIASSPASIEQGEELFNVYCYPCHGQEMAAKPEWRAPAQDRGMPGYTIDQVKLLNRSDEYIYATMHHGGAIMKRVSYHMSPEERWHVVNYVQSLVEKYK